MNGYGWPSWTGGPMHYADTVGLARRSRDRLDRSTPTAPATSRLRPAKLLRELAGRGEGFAGRYQGRRLMGAASLRVGAQSYPPALRWDAPLDVTTLPALLDTRGGAVR